MQFKKLLTVLLSGTVLLGACQTQTKTTTSSTTQAVKIDDSKQYLTMSWAEDIGQVNPHIYTPDQFITQDMVYEGFVRYGDNGVIEPALAESWTVSEDGRTYTFKLRDVKYTDGTPLTAQNVKRNFDTVFSEKNKTEHTWFDLTNRLVSYRAIDDKTFEMVLDVAYSATMYDLAMIRPIRFIADAAFPDGDDTTANPIKKPIGTGPWILKEKKDNEYAIFTRNENYWGEKPKLKEVTIKIIPDGQTRALEFESGNLDIIYGNGLISADTFDLYKKDSKYTTGVSQPLSTRLLILNASKSKFADKSVRQAMNKLVNKSEIAKTIFRDTETPADTIFSKSTPYADAGLTPYTYNVSDAEKALDAAGWVKNAQGIREKNGEKLTVYMPYLANKVQDKDLGEYFQGEWKKYGIEVTLEAYEEEKYWDNAKTGNFDMMLTASWGAPWDPHAWMKALTQKADHGNPENVALEALATKAELDKKINATLVEPDEKKVAQGYKEALITLHDEAVYIPLTYQSLISVYRTDDLGNVRFMPQEHELPLRYIYKK